ncbi:hypothetical protein HMPREF0973_01055 [Prevotella veroralis F0319]|uniref:Uncharacterized protein n=1 Tax=Prevotella veroralis F0319 TaxID=649761 RepID=C9MN70_9BACT|nr:hypothetical protein HMPREF0973_01055 [Prevotella veroralis F0319]
MPVSAILVSVRFIRYVGSDIIHVCITRYTDLYNQLYKLV